MEARIGVEPMMEVLQTSALPLGYRAAFGGAKINDCAPDSSKICASAAERWGKRWPRFGLGSLEGRVEAGAGGLQGSLALM